LTQGRESTQRSPAPVPDPGSDETVAAGHHQPAGDHLVHLLFGQNSFRTHFSDKTVLGHIFRTKSFKTFFGQKGLGHFLGQKGLAHFFGQKVFRTFFEQKIFRTRSFRKKIRIKYLQNTTTDENALGNQWPGTDIMIFKIFSPKKIAKKLPFFTHNKAKLCKNFDHNIGF
jgi:hypothetical protein